MKRNMSQKKLVLLIIVSCKYIKSTLLCNHGQQGLDENFLCDLIHHRESSIDTEYDRYYTRNLLKIQIPKQSGPKEKTYIWYVKRLVRHRNAEGGDFLRRHQF